MDIKEIAEQVSKRIYVEDGLLLSKFISEKFAEALIESYKAELLNEAGEPGTWEFRTYNAETDEVIYHVTQSWLEAKHYDQFPMPLYTSDQVAAAVLKATGPLEDQLAKAEQRVAEACALTYLEDYDLTDIAERVRAGEWRKFVKEV